MKPVSILICFFLCVNIQAQDMNRYFDFMRFLGDDIHEYDEVEFTWNMKGNIQVALNEGINALREGEISTSLVHLDSAINMDSSLWMSYYYRGIAWHQQDEVDEAMLDLKRCLNLNGRIAEAHLKLGDIYVQVNKFNEATKSYKHCIELNPTFTKGYYKLGNINSFTGQYSTAEQYYKKALQIDSSFSEAYSALGILKFRMNQGNNALIFFNKAITIDSMNALAYFWRGLVHANHSKLDLTLKDWNRAISLNPNNIFFINMRGYLNFELEDYESAFRDFRRVIMSSPIEESGYRYNKTKMDKLIDFQFAVNYVIRNSYGLPSEAKDAIQKACCFLLTDNAPAAMTPLSYAQKIEKAPSIFFMKAVVFEALGNYDSAIMFYSKALELDNDIFDAHKKRAVYRYETKDWKGAYADLKEMLRIQPNSQSTYRLSGLIKSNLKDYGGAILDVTKFIKSDTTDADMWKTRAFSRQKIKDYQGALDDYQTSLRINPNQEDIYWALSENYQSLGDTLKAAGIIRVLMKRNKSDINIQLGFIDLLIATKQYDSAQLYMRPLVAEWGIRLNYSLRSEYTRVLFLHGKTLILQGEPRKGIKSLKSAIRLNPNYDEARFLRAKTFITENNNRKAKEDIKYLKASNYRPATYLFSETN